MTQEKNTTRRLETCKVCGWTWFPRSAEKPRQCPKCKSARWDIGRLRAPGGGKKKQAD